MGYTHYWDQTRDFARDEWATISADIREILTTARHQNDIPLADGCGEGGTVPEYGSESILFNGLGDDSYETMMITRKRTTEYTFCKTARKPYDTAVTAVLCYLSTITRKNDPVTGQPIIGTEAFTVTSDGDGDDFLAGVELARSALPQYANLLDIPLGVMQDDRWCGPFVTMYSSSVKFEFCVDGRAYVLHKDGRSYCFPTHEAGALWLDSNKTSRRESDIWNPSGSFDRKRCTALAGIQSRRLNELLNFAEWSDDADVRRKPPAYARPGVYQKDAGRQFCYWVKDLLALSQAR